MSELIGRAVKAHKNLHKGCYSLRLTSRVVQCTDRVELRGCVMRAPEGGHAAIQRAGVRSVYAYVKGELVAEGAGVEVPEGARRARLNPFVRREFFDAETEQVIESAARVWLTEAGMFYQAR